MKFSRMHHTPTQCSDFSTSPTKAPLLCSVTDQSSGITHALSRQRKLSRETLTESFPFITPVETSISHHPTPESTAVT